MSHDPLQSAYTSSPIGSPTMSGLAGPTPTPAAAAAAGGVGASGGMIQLLPAASSATLSVASNQYAHARSQSTFVPMHSPTSSMALTGGNLSELQQLMNLQQQTTTAGGMAAPPANRLHGSIITSQTIGPAGILATPLANSATSLTSPTPAEYAYPVVSSGYDVYGEIGSGAFSTVFRAVVKDNGEEVAIKVIDLDAFNTNWEEIRREIVVQSQLAHPNVVKLKTAFVDGQDLWIVMSVMTAGSCASVMKELGWTTGLKDEVLLATILKEVLQALVYLHKQCLAQGTLLALPDGGSIPVEYVKRGMSLLGDNGLTVVAARDAVLDRAPRPAAGHYKLVDAGEREIVCNASHRLTVQHNESPYVCFKRPSDDHAHWTMQLHWWALAEDANGETFPKKHERSWPCEPTDGASKQPAKVSRL